MKTKSVLVCVLINLFSINLYSQDSYSAGLTIGPNFSKIVGDWERIIQVDYKPQFLTGVHLGFFLQLNVSKDFSVEPQLLYSEKGVKFDETISETQTGAGLQSSYEGYSRLTEKLNYLSLPVIIKYRTKNFSFNGGFYVSKLLKAHLEIEENITISQYDFQTGTYSQTQQRNSFFYKGTNGFNVTDFGYVLGVDYMSSVGFGMDIRIENGFSNIYENDLAGKFKNSTLHAGLRIRLTR